jgi:hypothetical protein
LCEFIGKRHWGEGGSCRVNCAPPTCTIEVPLVKGGENMFREL